MAKRTWIGGATTTYQVWKGTITTTTNAQTYIVTLTDSNGDTSAITYVIANPPDTTTTLVATGFITAWNASQDPRISAITATQSSGQVILTADKAGVAFTAAASGTGTWSGTGNTTDNSGPQDYTCKANWAEKAVPVAADDVTITGAGSILYNTNQSGVALTSFTVASGCSATLGAAGYNFRLSTSAYEHNGTGLAYVDLGASAVSPRIVQTSTASAPGFGLYLIGSAVVTLNVEGGSVGFARLAGQTATATTIRLTGSARVAAGSGVTATNWKQSNGTGELGCAATTVDADAGTLETTGSGAITTMNNNGATVYPNSTGTVGTLNAKAGTTDFNKSRTARTVTNLAISKGAKVSRDPNVVTVTTLTQANTSTLTAA